jgi:hypothetical protein
MQELLRHASTRVTLDTYTQAVTPAQRAAQTRGRHTVLSQREDRLGKRPLNQGWELLRKVAPFCAYEFSGKRLEVVGSKLASPTGFEPVLPP